MKILHLEDNPRDAELVQALLSGAWPDCSVVTVATSETFLAELVPGRFDLILSDFRLPGFNGLDALHLAVARVPDTPFIFVSGTVGEEVAVEIVRAGAADYLLKDRMHRLPLAITRALRDRTERLHHRAAESRLREQAELLDKARDGIVVTDIDRRIIFWNRGAERIFGWTQAETLGHLLPEFFGRAFATELDAVTSRVDREGEWQGELRLDDKLGRALVAEVRVTLILDEHGRPKSRLAIVTDITEKKSLEVQFLRAQRLESLGMLASGIAHDLNNILAPVLMGVPLIRTLATNDADRHVMDTIEKSATRGAALVRQILSFAHGTAGQAVLIQPKHVLREIAELIDQTFPKSIDLEYEIPNTLWTVRGNPTQLHQILLNLCVNARDAMPAGGSLLLSGRNEVLDVPAIRALPDALPGAYLVLEVADTGTGIAPENLSRIWDPFFTTKAEDKGTGLGLATVRGIVAHHGGFATVDSAVGRGTTFRIYLPAAEQPGGTGQIAGSVHPFVRRGQGELILVVDDEPPIRTLIATILAKSGYRVLKAANGLEALERISPVSAELGLVVTDLSMPELGGVGLAQALWKLNPLAKVLFMSGAGSLGTADRPPESSAIIRKPFTPEELLAAVRTALDLSPQTLESA